MERYIIDIYKTDALLKLEVEGENEKDATNQALHMLTVGDGGYSDIHEADFIESDAEYLIMGDYANRYTTKVSFGLCGFFVKNAIIKNNGSLFKYIFNVLEVIGTYFLNKLRIIE